ncbi:MAG TPA: hypothetical protein VFB66_16820 [Tepidisphaeraceae bacterium]|nr:hypothetical protein [Tepidisphaeraceae bacterium]
MTPEADSDARLAQCLMEIRHSAEQMALRSQELYKHADERLAALRQRQEAAAVPAAAVPKPGE